jgi:hypothetical protein
VWNFILDFFSWAVVRGAGGDERGPLFLHEAARAPVDNKPAAHAAMRRDR